MIITKKFNYKKKEVLKSLGATAVDGIA